MLQIVASRIDSGFSTYRQFSNPQNRSNNNNNNNNNNNRNNNNRHNNNRRPNNGKKPFSINTKGPVSNEEEGKKGKEYLCAYCGSAEYSPDRCPLVNRKKASSSSSHITNPEPKTIPSIRISDQPDVKLAIFRFTLIVSNISTETKF